MYKIIPMTSCVLFFFFFNDTATTEIYTLSLHDALPIYNKSGHHAHDKWVTPPKAYAGLRSDRWSDSAAIKRGKQTYQKNCSSCHGEDGRGTGPLAKSLAHAPADLTNHFHRKPGDGDAYPILAGE